MKTKAEQVAESCETAVNAVLMARAYYEVKREQVDAIKREELALCYYYVAEEHAERRGGVGERITEPGLDWLMSEERFAEYHHQINKVERERGIKPDTMPDEHCPACVAETVLMQAERLLIDIAWPLISEDGSESGNGLLYGDRRKLFLDLVCKLVVNRLGYKNPLTGKAA